MMKPIRTEALRKLRELLATTTDPEMTVKICTAIAKLDAQRRKARKPRRVTETPIKTTKEPSLDELVAETEKKRRVAAVEKKRDESTQVG